ncbi:MAG: MMPL family transporter, partial [Acidimicrobiales bacterium]
VDNKAEIRSKLVAVAAWVIVVVGLLLYWSFGSVLIPIKAVVLNLLSLTAAFGAIVWIFQDGRLSGLLNFTPTGLTDAQTPVLIFCIAFGLSMDYEVFLLSRIKEEWDRTGDTKRSVAVGLQRTGGIITAAAVLMAVVFLSFASGRVTFIQMVGIGLALSIIADATLVRTFLVPAFMAVAGRWNWWSPTQGRSTDHEI